MTFRINTRTFALAITLLLAAKCAFAKDYRSESTRAEADLVFLEQDHTIRRAMSIGRASGALSTADVDAIHEALEAKRGVPAKIANTWQKLLRVSQIQSALYDNKYFFPVGYEFETLHPNHVSSEEFEQGSKHFQKLMEETIGKKSARTFNEHAVMRDGRNREWKLVTENVRAAEWVAGGYEFVSPPLFDPGEVSDVATLAWRLGEKKFGQSNNMTGGHQTFTIVPQGEKATDNMVAKAAANLQLMQAQYAPTMFDILDIRRDGGVPGNNGPKNFFIRATVLDHQELIESMKNLDPKTVTLQQLKDLYFDKHVDKEFERTLLTRRDLQEIITPEQFDEQMKTPHAEKGKLDKIWKYRDTQLKYNMENPARTLWETRIGDYVADRPEQFLLKTLLMQKMIGKAWDLAKEDKIFQPDILPRNAGETDEAYWKRLKEHPAASKENFLKTLGVEDPNQANMILGRAFTIKEPSFKAAARPSYGFEVEGWTDDIVELIVPNDPKLRTEWGRFSRARKLKELEKKGITLGEYSTKSSRRLSTEFKVDTDRFPFMSPDIIVEDSGNWEIMSNGRNIGDIETLEENIKKIQRHIPDQEFGLHIHRFTPDSGLQHVKANPKKYAKFLERQSLTMLLEGYAEAGVREPHHAYDSWSLDRYSPKEIRGIEEHIKGGGDLSPTEIKGYKYHNMAYRPVRGGLDNEARDIGGDVAHGIRHTRAVAAAIDEGNFGPAGAEQSEDVFFEFKDHADPYGRETKRYTLLDAVEKRHQLTEQQKNLLHKFQFEIYKPAMPNYMYFVNPETPGNPFWDHNDIPAKYLDPKMARANFENNVALPLLNYDKQNYLSDTEKALLAAEKEKFADRVFKILQTVERDPRYKFLLEDDNFLYLCDYLKRSEHADAAAIPFTKVNAQEAARRQELLDELTKKLRGESSRFVRDTKVHEMMRKSLPTPVGVAGSVGPRGRVDCPASYGRL